MKPKLISFRSIVIDFIVWIISCPFFLFAQSGQMGFSSIMIDKSSTGTITQANERIIEDANQNWSMNEWSGYYIYITSGRGSGQIRNITGNTATTITVSPSFVNAPDPLSSYKIRQGYKEFTQNIKLKIYIQYNDGNRIGGRFTGYSCRIQASDTAAMEFVSVEKGSDLDDAWIPKSFIPPGQGCINWLVLQFPEYHTLTSGLYNIATVTVNRMKTNVDKPITFSITNCPNGGLPIGATEDSHFFFFDTTSNNEFSGKEEIIILRNTNEADQLLTGGSAAPSAAMGSYPNPFNPSTTIRYELTEFSKVHLVVYDMLGRIIDELVNSQQYEGIHSAAWQPHNVSSGIYFARLSIEGSVSKREEFKTLKLVYAR